MKTLLLTITLIIATGLCAIAQQKDSTIADVVVLNDGSIVKGTRITAEKPGHVRLRMKDGTEVEFPIESVAEVRKDIPYRGVLKPYRVQSKGLYANVTAGFLFGSIDDDPLSFTSGAAIGYRFFPQLYVAGGGGTDIHGTGDMFAPVYLRVGGEAMKTRVSPSYYFAGGYAFPFNAPEESFDAKGGAYYEGGLGVTFRTPSRIYWTLNVSYRQHKGERSYPNGWWWGDPNSFTTEKRTYRRFGLTVGMCF